MPSTRRSSGRGMTFPSRFGLRCWQLPAHSATNAVAVAERIVRFTAEFYDRLDELLPEQRGDDGTPSVTDFLLLDLPRVRDALCR